MTEERPITEIASSIIENVQELVRSEIRLAKAEITEEAIKAGTSIAVLFAGILLALYSFGFLLLAVVYGLSRFIGDSLAALLVALLVAVIAGVLVMQGVGRLKHLHPKPERTIRTVRENIQWARGQTK
jgi:uncharacterized membrane protein YqjE